MLMPKKLFFILFSAVAPVFATPTSQDFLNLNWRDTAISPAENFYLYANGNWQKDNPIPPEYASWGILNILNEKVQHIIHNMLIETTKSPSKPGSIAQKVGDFYYSGMDETTINKVGITPLLPEFERIQAIQNTADLQQVITHLQKMGVDVLFGFGSMQDYKDSTQMIAAAMQGGLGLPDRDYYFDKNPKSQKLREAYLAHIERMLILSGVEASEAAAQAKQIMAFETSLAKASLTNIQTRDPHATYHMMPIVNIDKLTPHFSWSEYLKERGLGNLKELNLAMPDFFKAMDHEISTLPLAQWKAYLRWRILDSYAAYLSEPFVNQNFSMVQKLSGTKKLLPRWKRVVATENGALGFAIGKMYVEKYFPKESKEQVITIIESIRKTLESDLKTITWMKESTRQAALKKLELMKDRVGYPNTWWDYSTLKVNRGPYILNVIEASKFLIQRDLNKIGKPIDRNEWAMTPQTVNAYYDPSMNNINLPAAVLQPPLFDPKAPLAVNYGGIGFIIGHEITHGFDDQGAQFDGEGNLKNWWTPEDKKAFAAATDCIADQFSQYVVDGDLRLKGKLVVGEAVADLGGIMLAYNAFKNSPDYKNQKSIDGFTPDQQFFLSTAHVWAINIRPEQARVYQAADPHPPGMYRVNGSLVNIPAFQEAFNLKKGAMIKDKRCVIW